MTPSQMKKFNFHFAKPAKEQEKFAQSTPITQNTDEKVVKRESEAADDIEIIDSDKEMGDDWEDLTPDIQAATQSVLKDQSQLLARMI